MSNKDASVQSPDFSGQIMADSTVEDINALERYNLKEKLKMRDPKSSLPELEDMSFLRDLGLIKEDEGVGKLTIAVFDRQQKNCIVRGTGIGAASDVRDAKKL